MAKGATDSPKAAYVAASAMLGLAFLFPIGLMIFDPTLMFERGWEQYVGTGIYFWAVLTLASELRRLWRDERAFEEAPALLKYLGAMLQSNAAPADARATAIAADGRTLPARVRQLAGFAREARSAPAEQLMEVNRHAPWSKAGASDLNPARVAGLSIGWGGYFGTEGETVSFRLKGVGTVTVEVHEKAPEE
ncbi:hypothetical protein [Paludisphaera rhizosphaerae]|uniref:hypothetical protein n=1 Tax=Paludisphaera rhizosphaerae TaxID=2711216 RepID=UPI0013ED7B66|nr:hypothetical protein [Paludisphaera rhizosphaerae]